MTRLRLTILTSQCITIVTRMSRDTQRDTGLCVTLILNVTSRDGRIICLDCDTGDGTNSSAAVNNVGAVLNIEGWARYCVINLSASIFRERQSLVVITNYMPRIIKHSSRIFFSSWEIDGEIYLFKCVLHKYLRKFAFQEIHSVGSHNRSFYN